MTEKREALDSNESSLQKSLEELVREFGGSAVRASLARIVGPVSIAGSFDNIVDDRMPPFKSSITPPVDLVPRLHHPPFDDGDSF